MWLQWFAILYLTNEQGYILGSAISMKLYAFHAHTIATCFGAQTLGFCYLTKFLVRSPFTLPVGDHYFSG